MGRNFFNKLSRQAAMALIHLGVYAGFILLVTMLIWAVVSDAT